MSGYDLGALADLVACPECRAKLAVTAESLICTGQECRLGYPVREGIPLLLVDEAELLEESAWRAAVGASETSGAKETAAGEESES